MAMNDNCIRLLDILKEQSDVVNTLIELGLSEVEAFKRDDTAGLLSITERQQDSVDRMHRLQQLKAGRMVAGACFSGRGETGAPEAEIAEENRRLAGLVKRLREVNETNRLLASMSLSYVRMMQRALGVFSGSYDERGKHLRPPGHLGRLDASA